MFKEQIVNKPIDFLKLVKEKDKQEQKIQNEEELER